MNEPPKNRDTIGELLFRYGGGVLIVVGCFFAFRSHVSLKEPRLDGSYLMTLGAASMFYSRICQIARR